MPLLSLDWSTLPSTRTLYCWVLSKEVSNTIFKVFGMMRPGIELRSPDHWWTIYLLGQWAALAKWVVFANGLEEQGSIPGWVIQKTHKMVLDAALLNTQHYKVSIKGIVEQFRERRSALPYTTPSGHPRLKLPTGKSKWTFIFKLFWFHLFTFIDRLILTVFRFYTVGFGFTVNLYLISVSLF